VTLLAILGASRLYRWAVRRAASADLDQATLRAYARRMLLTTRFTLVALAGAVLLTACPKPQPDPVPADCKAPNACADEPHSEGPPPVGSIDPPKP
jgi:hypothetical protein